MSNTDQLLRRTVFTPSVCHDERVQYMGISCSAEAPSEETRYYPWPR